MYKILRVGDPHCTVSNIKDWEKLVDFIIEKAIENKVSRIELLGDMFHTHCVIRMEVVDFWQKSLKKIVEKIPDVQIVLLVGNHDQNPNKELEDKMNALQTIGYINDNVKLINSPTVAYFEGNTCPILYLPHSSFEDKIFEKANQFYEYSPNTVVAHQTFLGATYENGFFAKDGIDISKIPQKNIISGHIHKEQYVGKCHYIGTPKWDSVSDANEHKGIWVFTHDKEGDIVEKDFISTEKVVSPIKCFSVKEGDEIPNLDSFDRNYVTLEGKSAWITKTKALLKDLASIRVIPTDRIRKVDFKKIKSIEDYLNEQFELIKGVKKEDVVNFLQKVN